MGKGVHFFHRLSSLNLVHLFVLTDILVFHEDKFALILNL